MVSDQTQLRSKSFFETFVQTKLSSKTFPDMVIRANHALEGGLIRDLVGLDTSTLVDNARNKNMNKSNGSSNFLTDSTHKHRRAMTMTRNTSRRHAITVKKITRVLLTKTCITNRK